MVNRNIEEPSTSGRQTASHLEEAVRKGDIQSYKNAMQEVSTYEQTHSPQEAKIYTAAITKKLEEDNQLPKITFLEAQNSFSKMDTNGNKRLEMNELERYTSRVDVNGLQKSLMGIVKNNYDHIRNISKWGESLILCNSDAISNQDINDGVKENTHLPTYESPVKAGIHIANSLGDVIRTGDMQAYNYAINEVNNYKETHSEQDTKTFTAAIINKLEEDAVLPAVSMLEAQNAFEKIDLTNNKRLEKSELDHYAASGHVNDLQRTFIESIKKNYDAIRQFSTWFEDYHFGNSDAIADQDINDGISHLKSLRKKFAKGDEGTRSFGSSNQMKDDFS